MNNNGISSLMGKAYKSTYDDLQSLGGFIRDCCIKVAYGAKAFYAYKHIMERYPKVKDPLEVAIRIGERADMFENDLLIYNFPTPEETFFKKYIEMNCEYMLNPKKAVLIKEALSKPHKRKLLPFECALLYFGKFYQLKESGEDEGFLRIKLKKEDQPYAHEIFRALYDMYGDEDVHSDLIDAMLDDLCD